MPPTGRDLVNRSSGGIPTHTVCVLAADTGANLIPERPRACDGGYLSSLAAASTTTLLAQYFLSDAEYLCPPSALLLVHEQPSATARGLTLLASHIEARSDRTESGSGPFHLAQISASRATSSSASLEIFSKALFGCAILTDPSLLELYLLLDLPVPSPGRLGALSLSSCISSSVTWQPCLDTEDL